VYKTGFATTQKAYVVCPFYRVFSFFYRAFYHFHRVFRRYDENIVALYDALEQVFVCLRESWVVCVCVCVDCGVWSVWLVVCGVVCVVCRAWCVVCGVCVVCVTTCSFLPTLTTPLS
jgi:hypothetical protein